MEWEEHVAHLGKKGNADSVLERKPGENRSLWIPRHKWDNNFKTDLKGIWWEGTNYIHLAEDREKWRSLVNMVMGLWVPQNAGSLWLAEEIFSSQKRLWSRLTVTVCSLNASQWDYYLRKVMNAVYCSLLNTVSVLQYPSKTKALHTYTHTDSWNLQSHLGLKIHKPKP
jgi:hypothetical protein